MIDDVTIRRLAPLLALVALAAACGLTTTSPSGGPTPTPTPLRGDMSAIQAALALRGATIHAAVSGDAGCPSVPGIHQNAARFELSLAGDAGQPSEVFLFRWRRASDFAAAEQAFSDCVDEYTAGIAGDVPIDGLEVEPWRAYGPGWSPDLLELLESALRDVGGG